MFLTIPFIALGCLLTIVFTRKNRKKNDQISVGLVVISCFSVLIILVIVFGWRLLENFSEPSQVDITPFEQMITKPFYEADEIEEKLKILKGKYGVEDFNLMFSEANSVGHVGSCSYTMHNWSIPASVDVFIRTYDSVENAQKDFEYEKNNRNKKEIVEISENVDAVLFNSEMYRHVDQFYMYDDGRHINTALRIGNIRIDFLEDESKLCEIGALTSKNIKMICDVLK